MPRITRIELFHRKSSLTPTPDSGYLVVVTTTSDSTAAPSHSSEIRLWVAVINGAVLAFLFALFFSLFTDDFVTGGGGKFALYVLAAVLGPITVVVLRVMADLLHLDRRRFTTLSVAGAVTFDGLFVGIWPGVYGHEGASLAVVAALILFGAASILLSDQLMPISKFPNRKAPAR